MGRRGPRRNPNSVRYEDRKFSGGPTGIPPGLLGKAEMPSFLKGAAKRYWQDHAPRLEARGLLTSLDEAAFASLCVAHGHMREAAEIMQREGEIIIGPRGKPREHPAVRIHASMHRHVLWGLRQFGMTPASRERLDITSVSEERI